MHFIVNQYGHYFRVTPNVELNIEALSGCTLYETERAMVEAVAAQQSLEVDEVDGAVYEVTRNTFGTLVNIDDRGFWTDIEETAEVYLTTFEM